MAKLTLITSTLDGAGKSCLATALAGKRKTVIVSSRGYGGSIFFRIPSIEVQNCEVIIFEEVKMPENIPQIKEMGENDTVKFQIMGKGLIEIKTPDLIIVSQNPLINPYWMDWFHRVGGKHIHLDRRYSYSEIIDPNSEIRKEVSNG